MLRDNDIIFPDEDDKLFKQVSFISIRPELTIFDIIPTIEKYDRLGIDKIGFENKLYVTDIKTLHFGEKQEIELDIYKQAFYLKKRVIKITEKYTIEDLEETLTQFKEFLESQKLSTDIYPIKLEIIDYDPVPHRVTFEKQMSIDSTQGLGKILGGKRYILDGKSLYKTVWLTKGYWKNSRFIPTKLAERMKQPFYYLTAEDVYGYTRNIYYATDLTVRNTRVLYRKTEESRNFILLDNCVCYEEER